MPKLFWRKGMTLTEVLVVLVILAVFVSLAVPRFERSMESAIGREARVALELIYAAEQVVYAQTGSYIGCDDINNGFGDCNNALNITLRPGNWQYVVIVGAPPAVAFDAVATRSGGSAAYNNKTIVLRSDTTWLGTWPIPY